MKIKETCACGASFFAKGDLAVDLYSEWVNRHECAEVSADTEYREVELTSNSTIAIGFATSRLDVPAPVYDPWDDLNGKRTKSDSD